MTPLRQRMIREMQLRQFSPCTVPCTIAAVAGLAKFMVAPQIESVAKKFARVCCRHGCRESLGGVSEGAGNRSSAAADSV